MTVTTLGYGDIRPTLPETRALAILEALVGVLFVAVFMGRIVGTNVGAQRES